jgi:hypothetical protein
VLRSGTEIPAAKPRVAADGGVKPPHVLRNICFKVDKVVKVEIFRFVRVLGRDFGGG